MANNIIRPNGTYDVIPKDIHKWHTVEKIARDTAESFGFGEIRIPTFEQTDLFQRSVGETTDVVQKEMYTVIGTKHKYTLRPEGTAGTIRAMLQNGMLNETMPQRVYYNLSCFRHEKVQQGRQREFHQFGVEMAGSPNPSADAEVISLAQTILNRLEIKNVELHINSIGCPVCRGHYYNALKDYYSDKKDKLCKTCLERFDRNPMRLLDCKEESCKEISKGAPSILDYLCDECSNHFEKLKKYLSDADIDFVVDPGIVRGLDYYTKTVFEFISKDGDSQITICAGGRYDGLIEQLGGTSVPALGFGMGMERVINTMEKQGCVFLAPKKCDIYFATMGDAALEKAMKLSADLRSFGYFAEYDIMGRGLKAQMKYANKIGAVYTIVLGDNELAEGNAKLKEMESGEESVIYINDKFTTSFEEVYFNKMLKTIDNENGSLFAFTGEDK